MKMTIEPLAIAGAFKIEQSLFADDRGQFSRLFCEETLRPVLGARTIRQVNYSRTRHSGTVRGLHYQNPPNAELKLIRCLHGAVWDVMVDLRPGSSTFLQWHAEQLSQENNVMVAIPEGCAHGFQALESDSELIYFHTACYSAKDEAGVNVLDKQLSIDWPLAIDMLSDRDKALPTVEQLFAGIKR